jgi:hypothetical protein
MVNSHVQQCPVLFLAQFQSFHRCKSPMYSSMVL